MKTRVDKNLNESEQYFPRRVSKNTQLYEEIKNSDLDNLEVTTNAKVIGDNNAQIDINKIKEILEKNYQDPPKRRSVKFDLPEEEEIELEKTREYDINTILEHARQEKEVDYEKERLKKIRDTQYDILKNLEIDDDEPQRAKEKTKEELMELINTINLNEYQNKNKDMEETEEEDFEDTEEYEEEDTEELNPLNILSDLKGDENTVVAGAKEFTEEMRSLEEKKEEQEEINEALDETLDESFYTNSMSFSKKDFADFDDLEDEKGSIVVKILIVIILIAIIAGIVLFLNEFLNLNWF